MELRYYFTYAAVFIFLQLFLYSFTRTLGWFFNLSITKRKALTLISYLVVNAIFLLQLARVISAFRSVALLLAFLLFAFLASIFTAFCYHLMHKKKSHWLRIAYPFILFGSLGLGVYNAYVPKVIHQTIVLDKPLDKPLRIGVASDFHLGKLFGGKQLDKLAEIFN